MNARFHILLAAAASRGGAFSSSSSPYNPMSSPQAFTASALSSHTLTADLSVGQEIRVALDVNLTVATPSVAPGTGAIVSMGFVQDSTGGRSVTWPAAFVGSYKFKPRQGASQASAAYFEHNGDNTYTLVGLDGINTEGEMDIRDFGAKDANLFSGAPDCAPIVEAALTSAAALTTGRIVSIPGGTYPTTSRPIVVSGNDIAIRGASRYNNQLSGLDNFFGPTIIVAPAAANSWQKPSIGAAPATGTGGSWPLDGTSNYFLDLSWCHLLRLDGLSACCIEFFLKPTATTAGGILSSVGGYGALSGFGKTSNALQFYIDGDDGTGKAKLAGRMTIGGVFTSTLPTTGVTLNSWTHVALDYDGAHLRVCAGGSVLASVAVTGSVTQSVLERLVLGPQIQGNGGSGLPAAHASIGSIRISKASRYTASYTAPTSLLTLDANTLLLHNFDNEASNHWSGARLQVFDNGVAQYSKPYCIPLQRTDNGGNLQANITISDLDLNAGGGIAVFATAHMRVDRCTIGGRDGIRLENNSFISQISECQIGSQGQLGATQTNAWPPKYGVSIGGACGGGTLRDVTITGFAIQCSQLTGGFSIRDLFLNTQSDVYCCVLAASFSGITFGNNQTNLDNVQIDSETSSPLFVVGCYASDIQALNVIGGQWDISGPLDDGDPFQISACGVVNFFGAMVAGGSDKDIVNSVDATTKINAFGSIAAKGITSWSNDTPNTTVTGCIT